MLTQLFPLTAGPIDALDWSTATFIASGCSGVVYEVTPGIVAKVSSSLSSAEATIQAVLAQEGLALPVLGYAQEMWLPDAIRRAACSPHGLRRWHEECCTCDQPAAILLMPRVERICRQDELQAAPVVSLIQRVKQVCRALTHQLWDCHTGNIALYQGRYVALDFGGMSGTFCS